MAVQKVAVTGLSNAEIYETCHVEGTRHGSVSSPFLQGRGGTAPLNAGFETGIRVSEASPPRRTVILAPLEVRLPGEGLWAGHVEEVAHERETPRAWGVRQVPGCAAPGPQPEAGQDA